MTSDAFVPVPLRARHLRMGDVLLSVANGEPWMVTEVEVDTRNMFPCEVTVTRGKATFTREIDPDETLHVLVAVPERDAMTICRDELGARLIERT